MKRKEIPQFGNLHGVKVLSTGTNIAGPFASTLLAEQGADVIQIESTLMPDMLRRQGDTWTVEHRNNRTMALNIVSEEGREVLFKLIKESHILIESSKGGTWEKWGLTDEALWQVNPQLVIAHVSGFGQTGEQEYVSRASFDTIGQAFSGYMAINGMPDPAPPYAAKPYTCDYVTALFTAWSITAALFRAWNTGIGESIDIAQFEVMARIQANALMDGLNHGKQAPRLGSYGTPLVALANVQQCGDGNWVVTGFGGQGVFKRVEELWGLADDPDFAEPHGTMQKSDGVRAEKFVKAAQEFFQSHRAEEAADILNKIQVPCSVIMTYEMMSKNSHYQARNTFAEWYDPNTGKVVKGINTIPKFKNNPSQIFRGGPTYGMDNEDVLTELGYSEDQVSELYAKEIIRKKW
ncbi:CoA transferase [Desulfitobacterium chlororespirans]|uniref:L-carnitine CoA-transferase n=1 Tax=Desulfitobacterium chlororespirans DSM 11544 TaxID=1121395 RepID=A0A1M7UB19_9FIRM|nr:CoA transferase [Desulfitobacterium chlororespirans]SHN80108.1 L-carnitine CoA-transferase [Desulfitobacterium chlororespirans DSM 11544]